MDIINGLSNDLLIKILSFAPMRVAVSTSLLSKRWEYLWMWVPKLEYVEYNDINVYLSESSCLRYQDFINKNLPLHKAPILEILRLRFCRGAVKPEYIKLWVGIAVSRFVRELSICYYDYFSSTEDLLLPSSLYTCKSLVTLELEGKKVLVDVPPMVCIPSLKTLQLRNVTYSTEDSLRLLLSHCPVLEDLVIQREKYDNVKELVMMVPSLQRLSLWIDSDCSSDGSVIVTLSLKYFKVCDSRKSLSYLIKHMPKLEEADIFVYKDLGEFLESITSVKRLSLEVFCNNNLESEYRAGIVFNQLEHLKLTICTNYWSKLLFRLLKDSPKLRVLNLHVGDPFYGGSQDYKRISWSNERSSVPKCLLKSLQILEFVGYCGRPEERDFLSFIFKNASRLKSPSILSASSDSE